MIEEPSDANLLERFVDHREEAAFTALVRRHGARVRSACRRVLIGEHDAEDVVQATFLLLAMKADRLDPRDSIGGWLCGVARRLSLHARAGVLRRSRRETPVAALVTASGDLETWAIPEGWHPSADPLAEIVRRDLKRLLDDELGRLPEKYREPIVLCDLEGLSHEEAAARLGCPAGSMSRRLGKARTLLRQRLSVRGLPAAVAVLMVVLAVFRGNPRSPLRFEAPSSPAQHAMAPFGPAADGHEGIDRFLKRVTAGDEANPSPAELKHTAEVAVQVAERLAALDPGHDRRDWRDETERLKTSGLVLALAADRGDAPSRLNAARGVQASCVRCHLAFQD